MGYYSQVSINVAVKENQISAAEAALKNNAAVQEWFNDLTINEDGWVELEDYYRTAYIEGTKPLAETLAPFADEGYIELHGDDDGDMWRIAFDGKGGWKTQNAVISWKDDAGRLA